MSIKIHHMDKNVTNDDCGIFERWSERVFLTDIYQTLGANNEWRWSNYSF